MAGDNEPVQSARLEIGASEKQLEKGLDAAASVVHKFTQDANRQFGQMSARIQGYVDKIDATEATVRLGLLEQAVRKLGGTSNLTAPQLSRVQEELRKLADQGGRVPASLKAIGKEADKLTAAAKAAASGGGLSGILAAISPAAALAAGGVAVVTGGVALVTREIAKAVVETATYAANLKNQAESYNINVVALQRLKAAAEGADVPLETVAKASSNITKALVETPDKVRALGLSVDELMAMSPDQQFFAVAEAIKAIENPTLQSAAALDLLGKTGPEVLRLLKTDMRAAADEAQRLGRIMDEDVVQASAQLKQELDTLDKTWQGFKANAASVITTNEGTAASVRFLTETFGTLSLAIQKSKGILAEGWPEAGLVNELVARMAAASAALRQETTRTAALYPGATPKDIQDMLAASEAGRRKLEEDDKAAAKRHHEVAARNRDLDGKASAEAMERERKRAEELANQLLQIKVRELAIRKSISEDAARSEIEAERKGSEWLQKRTKSDADVVARAEAMKADAKRLGMSAIDAQIDKIEEATAAAIRHVDALELEGKIGRDAAEAARDAYDEAADAEIRYAQQTEAIDKIGRVRDLFDELVGLLGDLGVKADSDLGKAASVGLQYLEVVQHNAKAAAAAMSGDFVTATLESVKSIRGYIGIIKTLFSEPSWKKVGREAGRVLGTEISEELAKQIEKTSKELKISVEAASLLNLSKAIQDSRRDAREFGVEIGRLLNGIADGSIPAREGIEELGTVWGEVREAAEAAGVVGDATLVAIIKRAKELGQLTPDMRAFLDEQAQLAQEGAKKIAAGVAQFDAGTVRGEDWATLGADAADFFGYGFQQAISEKGLLEAIDEQGEGLDAFFKKAEEAGDEAALAILGPFQELRNQLGEAGPLRGALTTLEGMGQVFESMANSGDLTAQRTAAMERSIQGTANALREGGVSEAAVLQAVQPQLRNLVSAAQEYGFELDANTQRLVQQSREAGFAFPTEPIVQVVDLLRAIATQLGAEIPDSAKRGAQAMARAGDASTEAFAEVSTGAEAMSEAVAGSWDAGAGIIEQRAIEMREGVAGELVALADEAALAAAEMGFEVSDEIARMAEEAESDVVAMTEEFERSLSEWGPIADDATAAVQKHLDSLPSVLDIGIRLSGPTPGAFGFNYDGSPDDDGDKTNTFKYGGIEDFGRESIVAVHGHEAIVPEGGGWFMDMLRQATREGIATAASAAGGRERTTPLVFPLIVDGREIARVVVDNFEGNIGGSAKRAADALSRY